MASPPRPAFASTTASPGHLLTRTRGANCERATRRRRRRRSARCTAAATGGAHGGLQLPSLLGLSSSGPAQAARARFPLDVLYTLVEVAVGAVLHRDLLLVADDAVAHHLDDVLVTSQLPVVCVCVCFGERHTSQFLCHYTVAHCTPISGSRCRCAWGVRWA